MKQRTWEHYNIFPHLTHSMHHHMGTLHNLEGGLTLRHLYAGLAMHGLLTSRATNATYSGEYLANQSVKFADALIEELEK